MKLGEFFIEITTKGNTKELEKSLKQLKQLEKETSRQIKMNKELSEAQTEEEKQLIRKNYAQKKEIDTNQKLLNQMKERNKAIIGGIKGFMGFISAVSLAVSVLDRFISANSKADRSLLTMAQSSGVSVDIINKYASAGKERNINITKELMGQTFKNIASQLGDIMQGMDAQIYTGMNTLIQHSTKNRSRNFSAFGLSVPEFLENLRDMVEGVDDFWASRGLEQMGISPELLPMLRMSKEDFANVKNRFLSEKEMKEEQDRALELEKERDELFKELNRLLIELIPPVTEIARLLNGLIDNIKRFFVEVIPPEVKEGVGKHHNEISQILSLLASGGAPFITSYAGRLGGTLTGTLNGGNFDFSALNPFTPSQNLNNMNNTFNTTINTTQPANQIMMNQYQRDMIQAQKVQQKVGK